MQCVSDLSKLRVAARKRVTHLRTLSAGLAAPLSESDRRALAFVTIELDNLIVSGLRQFTKSSLLGCRTSAGHRVLSQAAATAPPQAAARVYAVLNPSGYQKLGNPPTIKEEAEIAFRNPANAEKVLLAYGATNVATLQFAMGFNAIVFSEIAKVRHFFAHRAENTNERVRTWATNIGMFSYIDPETSLVAGRPGTGVKILDGWLAETENFFDTAL